MKIYKSQYRIVTDKYAGHEVQIRHWYFPFWEQVSTNTSVSVNHAKDFIEKDRAKRNFKRVEVKRYSWA